SSLFIKPKYKSTAVLYPSNLIPYSSETPTELMLQIFESDDIRDSLIKKLNLATHYDIDLTQNNAYTKLIKEFESNVDIRKTEYESVVIEIFDTDPQFACNMVKDMVTLFNMKARDLQRSKSKEVLKITKDQMDGKQKQIDTLQKRLNDLRMNYGILDYDIQAKESMRAYYKMLGNGQKGNANFLNSTIENLKEKGGEYVLLKEMFDAATLSFDKLKEEYEITLRDVEKKLTYTNYVSSPIPSDKKTYPIRWLIVTISSITTMFFALIIIALIENVRKKEKTKNNMSDV
ncbi:MAG: hypothetical protein HGB12_17660, partial [Bacteroidetes bacterium]|nr:hypothetical protein [Bacteroidota bacterium]